MKEIILKTFIAAILLAIVFAMVAVTIEEEQVKEEGNIQCEHEFVITSRFNWFLDAYKTYSKCIKCGKEI